jgi:hypothetical protein
LPLQLTLPDGPSVTLSEEPAATLMLHELLHDPEQMEWSVQSSEQLPLGPHTSDVKVQSPPPLHVQLLPVHDGGGGSPLQPTMRSKPSSIRFLMRLF